jgi:hypothetical protein
MITRVNANDELLVLPLNPLNIQLQNILEQYEQEFKSDPHLLRKSIPIEEMWRLLIDGDRQQQGCMAFDLREPGYLLAMTKALQKIFTPSADLTNFSKRLHALATRNVDKLMFSHRKSGSGVYRISPFIGFSLGFNRATEMGIKELLAEIKNYPDENDFPILRMSNGCHYIFLYPDVVDTLKIPDAKGRSTKFFYKLHVNEEFKIQEKLITFEPNFNLIKNSNWVELFNLNKIEPRWLYFIFPHARKDYKNKFIPQALHAKAKQYAAVYTQDIMQAKAKLDRLKVIITYIHKCELLHPYLDGNTRTYSLMVLNHLLMVNGFPLTIQNNPNNIYAFSVDELIKEVLDGMQRTLDLAKILPNGKRFDGGKFDPHFSTFTPAERLYLTEVFKIEEKGRKDTNLLTVAGKRASAALNKLGLFGGVAKFRHEHLTQPKVVMNTNILNGP